MSRPNPLEYKAIRLMDGIILCFFYFLVGGASLVVLYPLLVAVFILFHG